MKWPWVSHDSLVALIQEFGKQSTAWQDKADARYAALEARYDTLVAHLLTVATPKSPEPIQRPELDPVSKAIADMAGNNPRLRSMMGKQAQLHRSTGMTDDAIASAIYQGYSDDDGLPA